LVGVALLVCHCGLVREAQAQSGFLERMRDDVRSAPAPAAPDPPPPPSQPSSRPADYHDYQSPGTEPSLRDTISQFVATCAVLGITFPFYGPHVGLCDNFAELGTFPSFPYQDGCPGSMGIGCLDCVPAASDPAFSSGVGALLKGPTCRRRWAGRLDVEYTDEFNDVTRLGGHLLLSTSARFDLDAELGRFEERLAGGGRDRLWLGDCNLVFRFAQAERVQFRSGIGMNWLGDGDAVNLGFNFTYSADFFPARPWVLTAGIDWGTLGRAELFRFRTTAGVLVNRFEAYTGFEYQDIDSTQFAALLAGLRVWF
jgi:hypothetical protein